ncbi:MAG: hypothetical protein LBT97_03300 [Planctomycetota bacterium]|jgi:hypothetical protein|nr:hypothetical protein [Planctomycetota bacterium]
MAKSKSGNIWPGVEGWTLYSVYNSVSSIFRGVASAVNKAVIYDVKHDVDRFAQVRVEVGHSGIVDCICDAVGEVKHG